MNTNVFISLGTNLGNKVKNLSDSRAMIENRCGLIRQKSRIYESPPWGYESFNNYLNQVIEIETKLTALEILQALLEIERDMGRTRDLKTYQDRPIDLDIIYFADQIIHDENLHIPHPRLYNRNFILMPLNDIASGFIDPNRHKTVSELLLVCTDNLTTTVYE